MKLTSRAIIIDDNKLLALFRKKKIGDKIITYYAIPGGHVEGNETLEETAIREVNEELNLNIKILGYLGNLHDEDRNEYYFHGKIISGTPKLGGEELDRNSDDNYYEFRYLPLNKIEEYNILSIKYIKKAINEEYEDGYIFR